MVQSIQWFDPAMGAPVVSISRSGLTFNRAAVAALDRAAFVEVGLDVKARCLVVKAAEGGGRPGAEDATGRAAEGATGRALPFWRESSTTPFVRLPSKELVRFVRAGFPDLDTSTATKYPARLDPETGYLLVDLRQPLSTRRRKKA